MNVNKGDYVLALPPGSDTYIAGLFLDFDREGYALVYERLRQETVICLPNELEVVPDGTLSPADRDWAERWRKDLNLRP